MIKYKILFNKIESFLLKICIISILILIVLQGIITRDSITIFSDKNLQGIALKDATRFENGYIILRLENEKDFEDVEILINGETIEKFNGRKEVKIKVYNNDIVEINGAKYNKNVKVKVVGITKNIEHPKLNTVVTTFQSIEVLCRVKLK